MSALTSIVEPLTVQNHIHLGSARPGAKFSRACPEICELLCIVPAAFKAGAVTGGERGYFIEEEQFGVSPPPHRALAVVKLEHAADPLPRCPSPPIEHAVVIVQPPAAIAEEQSARRIGEQIAKGIDAILEWHLPSGVMPREGGASSSLH
jgi:hypothetical protein